MDSKNTLSNVDNPGGVIVPPCAETMIGTIPEAKSSQTGVSVRYVPQSNFQWFALRASYGREDKALDFFLGQGVYGYIPKKNVYKRTDKGRKVAIESLIPNLLFVYSYKEQIKLFVEKTPELSYVSYYYDHLQSYREYNPSTHRFYDKNPELTIPRLEMENFILATCSHNEHLLQVSESQCHYKSGDVVRVIDGEFKGVEGRVARVAGQQRVIVSLSGIGLIATAYIPTAFIDIISS
jgi:transcription antitermination factor NusG